MKNTGSLEVTLPSDREVRLTRVFDAPRAMVYDALTKPELIRRWFGPRGFTMPVCEVDLRVGGAYRYVLQGPDGGTMGMSGAYLELNPPNGLMNTEAFDDYPFGEARVTTVLTEAGGRTTLVCTTLAPSKEIRDAVVASGMEHGAAESYDRLAELLMGAPAR